MNTKDFIASLRPSPGSLEEFYRAEAYAQARAAIELRRLERQSRKEGLQATATGGLIRWTLRCRLRDLRYWNKAARGMRRRRLERKLVASLA